MQPGLCFVIVALFPGPLAFFSYMLHLVWISLQVPTQMTKSKQKHMLSAKTIVVILVFARRLTIQSILQIHAQQVWWLLSSLEIMNGKADIIAKSYQN